MQPSFSFVIAVVLFFCLLCVRVTHIPVLKRELEHKLFQCWGRLQKVQVFLEGFLLQARWRDSSHGRDECACACHELLCLRLQQRKASGASAKKQAIDCTGACMGALWGV